jgi:hypothetical protein
MILKYLPVLRVERKSGSKKKYRYLQPAILKCESCGAEREVKNLTGKNKRSETHFCLACSAKQNGILNKGNPAYNKGKFKPSEEIQKGSLYRNTNGYLEIYLGNNQGKGRAGKYSLLHRLVTELYFQRTFDKSQVVHHIDGNQLNNNPWNLLVCDDMREHKRIHTQLHKLALGLVEAGIIQFDFDSKTYFMPHLEEILNAYRVNLGEPYVLKINNLGNMAILSQAEFNTQVDSEGSTTIPLGSSDQEVTKRTAA